LKRVFIILCIILANPSAKATTSVGSQLSGGGNWEFYGGYSYLTGYYSSHLKNGYNAGINFFGPFPFVKKYLIIDGGISMNRWTLLKSNNSILSLYSARAGGIFYYPVSRYFKPYAGFSFSGSLVHLKTENTGKEVVSYKPGAVLKTGFYGPSYSAVGTRIGIEQEYIEVSNEILKPVNVHASVFMNFHGLTHNAGRTGNEERFSRKKKVNTLFESGIRELGSGNSDEAKKYFYDVLELHSDHKGAAAYIHKINAYEASYKMAEKFISAGQYYRAIPIFKELRPYMKNAGIRLVQIRKQLSGNISELEKNGIKAYEMRDYELCIVHMKKILLIDPENRIADIYLPRSVKRKKALESFK
jgi:tetratricopeptide (TPR) repeat protein